MFNSIGKRFIQLLVGFKGTILPREAEAFVKDESKLIQFMTDHKKKKLMERMFAYFSKQFQILSYLYKHVAGQMQHSIKYDLPGATQRHLIPVGHLLDCVLKIEIACRTFVAFLAKGEEDAKKNVSLCQHRLIELFDRLYSLDAMASRQSHTIGPFIEEFKQTVKEYEQIEKELIEMESDIEQL